MKISLLATLVLYYAQSHAFTEVKTYNCLNGDQVRFTSSLMPTGDRFERVQSEQQGRLSGVECRLIEQNWNSYGSENCYVNEKALFTFHRSGQTGMLRTKKNSNIYFTICRLSKILN